MTHIPAALRTGMPGRRHRKQDHRAISFRLPASRFSQETDQRFQARLLRRLARSRHLEVAFRSPTAAARFQVAAARSTLPADPFDAALKPNRTRSAYRSPTRPGLPRIGRDLRDRPVARLGSCASRGWRISTPLGGRLNPLMDRSVQSLNRRKANPNDSPDSPSLPAGLSLLTIGLRIIVPGSLLLTGFNCSVNLLEP